MIEMREAADPRQLDHWPGPVGGYINHVPPWSVADFARHSHKLRISVRSSPVYAKVARVIDVEPGAALAHDVMPFVRERERLGFDNSTLYCDLAQWPEIRGELHSEGIGLDQVRLWIAHWTGRPRRIGPDELGPGWEAWAHQFENAGPYTRTAVWGRADFSLR